MYEGASTLLVKTLFLPHFSFFGEFLRGTRRDETRAEQSTVGHEGRHRMSIVGTHIVCTWERERESGTKAT